MAEGGQVQCTGCDLMMIDILDSSTVQRLKGNLPDNLEQIMKLREDPKTMQMFCDTWLPCVVGKVEWKKSRCIKPMSEIATVSDEAFTLLVLENIWDVWTNVPMDEWNKTKELSRRRSIGRIEEQTESENGSVAATVIRAGKFTKDYVVGGRYRGWSIAGIKRYNDLLAIVKTNRDEYKEYDEDYMERAQEKYGSKKRRQYVHNGQGNITLDEDMSGWL